MRRVWLSTLVLAVCALAVGFVLTESSRVAAEGQAAGSSGVRIRASEQMTGMVSSMLYLPVVGGGSANLQPTPVPPTEHSFKYRAVYALNGERIVGFDNERGKGDHCHLDGQEMLVRAKHLAELDDPRFRIAKGKKEVGYHHFLLERHGIVFAQGMATETPYPGPMAVAASARAPSPTAPKYPTKRASVSRLSCLEVVPDATRPWKPEMAPQAMVTNSRGISDGVPTGSASLTMGATTVGLPISTAP